MTADAVAALPPTARVAARYLATTPGDVRGLAAKAIDPSIDVDVDPIGVIVNSSRLPNGIFVSEVTAPIGVVGLEVPEDSLIAACILAGNVVVAAGYGDRDARAALGGATLPVDAVIGVETLPMDDLDAVIRRDGSVVCAERIAGDRHVFIDHQASPYNAVYAAMNAATTDTAETFLIHAAFDAAETDKLLEALETVGKAPTVYAVTSPYEAIEVIDRFSSGRCETILTDSIPTAQEFRQKVDAGVLVLNCSPAFAGDLSGERRILGHTRTRWHLDGNGQTRLLSL